MHILYVNGSQFDEAFCPPGGFEWQLGFPCSVPVHWRTMCNRCHEHFKIYKLLCIDKASFFFWGRDLEKGTPVLAAPRLVKSNMFAKQLQFGETECITGLMCCMWEIWPWRTLLKSVKLWADYVLVTASFETENWRVRLLLLQQRTSYWGGKQYNYNHVNTHLCYLCIWTSICPTYHLSPTYTHTHGRAHTHTHVILWECIVAQHIWVVGWRNA